jgi:hypothetical protein
MRLFYEGDHKMSFALLFAILMILWAVSWFIQFGPPFGLYANNFLIWILFALIGWHVFGPLIHP